MTPPPTHSRGGRSPRRGGARSSSGPKREPTGDIRPLEPTDVPPDIEAFAHWSLGDEVQAAIAAMGITKPTPIQRLAIGPVLEGRDCIAKAETGTGKTLAFGAPMVAKIDPARSTVLGLVLCPTRELAEQVQKVLEKLAQARGAKTALVVGGEPLEPQVKALKAGAQIVVGTPGRVLDLYRQKFLSFPWTEFAILDEADVMLEIGFIDDVKLILSYTPDERQTLLFSATFPPELLKLAREYTKNPVEVATAAGVKSVDTISQSWMWVDEDDQPLALIRLIEQSEPDDVFLVFCPRRTEVDRLMRRLERMPWPIKALHGGYDQEARFRVMTAFRERSVKALVATDVASRGLDVAHVTHVINLGSPQDVTDYTHRIGRTGRAGRSGTAITIVSGKDDRKWKHVLREATWPIPQVEPPPATGRNTSRPDSGRGRGAQSAWAHSEKAAPVAAAPIAAPLVSDEVRSRYGAAAHASQKARADKPVRAADAEHAPRRERAPREERRPRAEPGDRAPREERGARAPREERGEHAPRGERTDRGPREERGIPAPRAERAAPAPREERADRAPRDEQARRAPREDRAPRDDRAPREERAPREDRAPRGDRAPRDDRRPRADARPHATPPPRADRGAPPSRDARTWPEDRSEAREHARTVGEWSPQDSHQGGSTRGRAPAPRDTREARDTRGRHDAPRDSTRRGREDLNTSAPLARENSALGWREGTAGGGPQNMDPYAREPRREGRPARRHEGSRGDRGGEHRAPRREPTREAPREARSAPPREQRTERAPAAPRDERPQRTERAPAPRGHGEHARPPREAPRAPAPRREGSDAPARRDEPRRAPARDSAPRETGPRDHAPRERAPREKPARERGSNDSGGFGTGV